MRLQYFSTGVRYFLAVAEAGSVNRAAALLHVAASAVSRQIGKLEADMGLALFERSAQGMAPTEAGWGLLAQVQGHQAEVAGLGARLEGLAEQAGRRLRLACTEGFAAEFMPLVLEGFRQRHPQAEVELRVAAPDEVSARLQQGEADLGLRYLLQPEPALAVLHSMRAPLYALMRPGHALAGQARLSLAEVVAYPLAMGPRGLTGRQLVDMACSVQGLRWQAAMVCNLSAAMLVLLREQDIMLAGYHTAVRHIREGRLVAVPLRDSQLRQRLLQLLAAPGRRLTPLQQAFADALAAALQSYVARRPRGAV